MNRFVTALPALFFLSNVLSAQPLSGSFTVGGTSPDFVALQDAANALKTRGVSGPTFFNIRPGVYMRNGGNNTVMVLDSIVAGLSSSNRITFQPDAAAGGSVDNVILQMEINNSITADQHLVLVGLDHVSFLNLTFQESDSSEQTVFNFALVQLRTSSFNSPTVDGILFQGCQFIGTAASATENGIELGQGVADMTIRGNTFLRLLKGISGVNGTSFSRGTMIVEDNQFLAGWRSASGSGNPLGSSMELFSENLIIRRNTIDFNGSLNGGYLGISVLVALSGSEAIIVEKNSVKGSVGTAIVVQGFGRSDSLVIANNMISANGSGFGISIFQNPGNAKILFNTILVHGSGGLFVDADNSTVLNNIVIIKPSGGFSVCYQQGASTTVNFQSDYNVLLTTGNPPLLVVRPGNVGFFDLASYQSASGLDTNSISKDIDVIGINDLHLTDCQSQDPDLKGLPVPGVTVDFDGQLRSTVAPMIGADENGVRTLDMFADPFRAGLSGTAFSLAAGKFDNILFDGLAIPDYDNRLVRLYHNLGNTRSFVQSGILSTGFTPTVAKFFDLDHDNHLDLIVGGDTTALKVFWGDGFGNFPSDTTIITRGRVRSLDTGRVSVLVNSATILITEDNGFLPNTSWLAFLGNDNGRHLFEGVVQRPGPCCFNPDTIPAVLTDFIVGNFDGNSDPEVAALSITPLPPAMYVFNDTNAQGGGGFLPYGARYRYQLGTGSFPGHASSIIMGDFDGDADNDLTTLGTFSSCMFIRNDGNFAFSSEPIDVAGAQALVSMDYENDGDLDFVTLNERLEINGITVFLNDGTGNFVPKENCFFPFAAGRPFGAIASDFDQDGKTDIAVVSAVAPGIDSLVVLYNLGGGITHTPGGGTHQIPQAFSLLQNYPNPFNPSTRIEYALPAQSHVSITIYNLLGQEVISLIDQEQPGGRHAVEWNGRSANGVAMSSGVYFYGIKAGQNDGQLHFASVRKMLLLK